MIQDTDDNAPNVHKVADYDEPQAHAQSREGKSLVFTDPLGKASDMFVGRPFKEAEAPLQKIVKNKLEMMAATESNR